MSYENYKKRRKKIKILINILSFVLGMLAYKIFLLY